MSVQYGHIIRNTVKNCVCACTCMLCLKYVIYFLDSGSVVRVQSDEVVIHGVLPNLKTKKLHVQLFKRVDWYSLLGICTAIDW